MVMGQLQVALREVLHPGYRVRVMLPPCVPTAPSPLGPLLFTPAVSPKSANATHCFQSRKGERGCLE